jgi:DNA-binding NarL/FixJ family response regulator
MAWHAYDAYMMECFRSVGVLDNDPLALRMMNAVLHTNGNIKLVWLERNPTLAMQSCLVESTRPGVLVLDMALDGISGIQVCAELRQVVNSVRVIGVTAYRPEVYMADALACGMETVVSKMRMDDLITAILREEMRPREPDRERKISEEGLPTLSPRELEVLRCFSDGLDSGETMKRLNIGRSTLASYEHRAFDKLGAHNRVEAVAICIRSRLIT